MIYKEEEIRLVADTHKLSFSTTEFLLEMYGTDLLDIYIRQYKESHPDEDSISEEDLINYCDEEYSKTTSAVSTNVEEDAESDIDEEKVAKINRITGIALYACLGLLGGFLYSLMFNISFKYVFSFLILFSIAYFLIEMLNVKPE